MRNRSILTLCALAAFVAPGARAQSRPTSAVVPPAVTNRIGSWEFSVGAGIMTIDRALESLFPLANRDAETVQVQALAELLLLRILRLDFDTTEVLKFDESTFVR